MDGYCVPFFYDYNFFSRPFYRAVEQKNVRKFTYKKIKNETQDFGTYEQISQD